LSKDTDYVSFDESSNLQHPGLTIGNNYVVTISTVLISVDL